MNGTCWDEDARELVHKSHRPTGRTWVQRNGTSEITWQVWVCQCGADLMDVFGSARELPR